MAMIDRYKKVGGFLQLLVLIETCAPVKQEKFLAIIHDEAPHWEDALRRRLLSIERITGWDTEPLTEVVTRLQPLTLAIALQGMKPLIQEKIMKLLTHSQKRQVEDRKAIHASGPAEISAANIKILNEVREMALHGILRFEKFDSDLFVEENIEERLSQSQGQADGAAATPTSPAATVTLSAVEGKTTASAAEEMEALRRKVANLNSEVLELKRENRILVEKIQQIRKFAS